MQKQISPFAFVKDEQRTKVSSLPYSEHRYYTDKAIFVFSNLLWKIDGMKIEQPEDTVISITPQSVLYVVYIVQFSN